MTALIQTIPHTLQRYPTSGDWIERVPGYLEIFTSAMGDWRYEFLVGFHELIEATLCRIAGVTSGQVDDFDMKHERSDVDIGSLPEAPYHFQHMAALKLEEEMAELMGVDWKRYESALDALYIGEKGGEDAEDQE